MYVPWPLLLALTLLLLYSFITVAVADVPFWHTLSIFAIKYLPPYDISTLMICGSVRSSTSSFVLIYFCTATFQINFPYSINKHHRMLKLFIWNSLDLEDGRNFVSIAWFYQLYYLRRYSKQLSLFIKLFEIY